jgi:hypothetical protein
MSVFSSNIGGMNPALVTRVGKSASVLGALIALSATDALAMARRRRVR